MGIFWGGFKDQLMHFSKGALRLTSHFGRHHCLLVREPRCACQLPLVSARFFFFFFAPLLLINLHYCSLIDAYSSLASINSPFLLFFSLFQSPFSEISLCRALTCALVRQPRISSSLRAKSKSPSPFPCFNFISLSSL